MFYHIRLNVGFFCSFKYPENFSNRYEILLSGKCFDYLERILLLSS